MGRGALLFLLLLFGGCQDGLLTSRTSESGFAPAGSSAESAVRSAIPAVEAWHADHQTYRGITLAGLRNAYDTSLADVSFSQLSDEAYCVESDAGGTPYYKPGPAAPISAGRCGQAKAKNAPPPPPTWQPDDPIMRIQMVIPAAEAWRADHGTYAGMTLAKLRRYDAGVPDVTFGWLTAKHYCVESTAGGKTRHFVGPANAVGHGRC